MEVEMLRKLANYLALAGAYIKLNFAAQLEYRGAFISQAAAMFVNDIFWVVFWILFFTKFKALRGWHVEDVITIWALTAAGFGLAYGICGNALNIAGLILSTSMATLIFGERDLLFSGFRQFALNIAKLIGNSHFRAKRGFYAVLKRTRIALESFFLYELHCAPPTSYGLAVDRFLALFEHV